MVVSALVSWGLFRHFTKLGEDSANISPFQDTRQLPAGPQLQAHPREDWLKYREQQEQSLESYSWEDRGAGKVRIPIERAMELALQKGLPVQNSPAAAAEAEKPAAQGGKKP